MKKMMKKAVAFVMAFAMVLGFFAVIGADEAKAADGDYRYRPGIFQA